jgi:UDPglucose 6-dehydrogenase
MRIAVIGVGHVGLVSAACFASWGHDVVGLDHDAEKLSALREGRVPFFEPELEELVRAQVAAGRLRFTGDLAEATDGAEVVFVCVGTPSLPGGGPNLSYVEAVGREVASSVTHDLVLVEKSTVPANTGARLDAVIEREVANRPVSPRIEVASNPEFLREGSAVKDTLHPDRIVIGTSSPWAADALRRVYATVLEEDGCPLVEVDVPTAELIKHASNAFLATKISFINAVARICDRVGGDVNDVALGMGLDKRIGPRFLQAGLGYGGSCFPKDIDAFIHLADQVGYDFALLREVREVNRQQRELVLAKLRAELWNLDDKTVAVLGAAFKPGTDDLREAPALHVARLLRDAGASVRIWDPVALQAVAKQEPWLERCDDVDAALEGAHAAVIATEWPEVSSLPPERFRELLAYPIVIDARNALDPDAMIAAGLRYHSIGRRSVT